MTLGNEEKTITITRNEREEAFGWGFDRSVLVVLTSERLSVESLLICFACKRCPNAYETLHRCGGCQTVFYCGPERQRKDWKGHKGTCYAAQETSFRENELLARNGTMPH